MADLFLISEPEGHVEKHVIFIHGLQGHHKDTWKSSLPPYEFWPTWLSGDIEGLAIWTIGYKATVSRWQGTAMHLIDRAKNVFERIMLEPRLQSGEIVFVGHSLGGLIIKQMFRDAESQLNLREDAKSFVERARRVAFLGTPHSGSDLASTGDKLRILLRPSASTNSLIRNDPNLRDLNNWYKRWSASRNIIHLILMESIPHKIWGMIVKPDSADPGLKANAISVDENHESICKPKSKTAETFLHVHDFISKQIDSAQTIWIRSHYGLNAQGWAGYGNWANCPHGVDGEYYIDDEIRFHNSSSPNLDDMSGLEGIQAIRKILHKPATSVRLAGLSGVGKTRLLQALFDTRIGTNPLNKAEVFYADISDSPSPSPRNFAEKLIASHERAVLAVDNCPPDVHKRLTSVCSAAGSLVSLVTVEYDVREDQPEETEVFLLEPASPDLIQKVIQARFDYVSQVDSRTIADFSGGNSRIAIALANTIKRGENLSSLKDVDLFERLFHQRNTPDRELLKSAEVCSLVYSFECNTIVGSDQELHKLSSLAAIPVEKLYEHISELKRRDLIQQRGVWRAVLPHALANRLAQRALENIPLTDIYNTFESDDSDRILKSFSRRLSYLHGSDFAKQIANTWLSDGGILSDISNLNEKGICILKNIAPVSPEAVLSSIKKAASSETADSFLSRDNINYIDFTRLLRSLAYEEDLFSRAVDLLCGFALSEKPKENNNSIRSLLKSLFYICLSGTHATAEQRLTVIEDLIQSGNEEKIELAVELLSAALESWHFSAHHQFEFGAHSRDHGFCPKNQDDSSQWFKLFTDFAVDQVISNPLSVTPIKELLAQKFRGLWVKAGMYDLLEEVVNKIIETGEWKEGWVAVKATLRFHGESMEPGLVFRLNDLERLLEPITLVERARLYAFSTHNNSLDLIDIVEDESASCGYQRVEELSRTIGQEVVNNELILTELLPELLSENGSRLYSFGQGLADGCAQPIELWKTFKQQMALIDTDRRNYNLPCGFLNSLSEKCPESVNKILDDAVVDVVLGTEFPALQCSVPIDNKGIERLKSSLGNDIVPISKYHRLAYGRVHETISDEDFCDILKLISSKPDGDVVALDILQMRLHRSSNEVLNVTNIISSFAQELLLSIPLLGEILQRGHLDYGLGNIIELCFDGGSAVTPAKDLCEKLARSFANHESSRMDSRHVLEALAIKQPLAFLDGFLGGDSIGISYRIEGISSDDSFNQVNPLSKIDDDIVLEWCKAKPDIRYCLVAAAIQPYQVDGQNSEFAWTPLAQKIILNSSDPTLVLKEFKSAFRPMLWSGSRAEIMHKRLPLLTSLKNHENPLVAEWAAREEVEFMDEISSERKWEQEREGSRDERFE